MARARGRVTRGPRLRPDALRAFPRTAALVAQAAPQALKGFEIGRDDERAMRKVLDRTKVGAALIEAVEAQFPKLGGGEGGGGGGGGPEGGGG